MQMSHQEIINVKWHIISSSHIKILFQTIKKFFGQDGFRVAVAIPVFQFMSTTKPSLDETVVWDNTESLK